MQDKAARNYQTLLIAVGVALLVLSAKWYVIDWYGINVPFNDQWVDEVALYHNYETGSLTKDFFFRPHNEHRIVFTRLWNLLLYEVNGRWNTRFQMWANSFLHVSALACMMILLCRGMPVWGRWLLASVIVAAGAYPWGYINTLGGFQSQFYFALLFQLLAAWVLVEQKPLHWRWWLGWLPLVAAVLSLGSGVLVAAAVAGVLFVRAVASRACTHRERVCNGIAVLLLCVFSAVALAGVPKLAGMPHAESITSFVSAMLKALSWPYHEWVWPSVILQAPVAILAWRWIRSLRKGEMEPPYDAYIVTLGALGVGSAVAFAYARGIGGYGPVSHHGDIYAVSVAANAAALVRLIQHASATLATGRQRNVVVTAGLLGWMAVWCGAYAQATATGGLDGPLLRWKQTHLNPGGISSYLASRGTGPLNGTYYMPSITLDVLADPQRRKLLPSPTQPRARPLDVQTFGDAAFLTSPLNGIRFGAVGLSHAGREPGSLTAVFRKPAWTDWVEIAHEIKGAAPMVSLVVRDEYGRLQIANREYAGRQTHRFRVRSDTFIIDAQVKPSTGAPAAVAFEFPYPVGRCMWLVEGALDMYLFVAAAGVVCLLLSVALNVTQRRSKPVENAGDAVGEMAVEPRAGESQPDARSD